MNILVACQHYHPEPYRLADLCESIVKLGHGVTVLTGLPNYPEGRIYDGYRKGERREEYLNGVKIVRSFLIPRGKNHFMLFLNYISYAFFASLRVLKIRDEFDVVFVHQTSPVLMAIPALVYKMKYKKKVLIYCGDPWPDSLAAGGIKEGSIIYRIFWLISKWIYSAADKLMVTSYMFRNYFNETFGIDINQIEHLPSYAEDCFTFENQIVASDKYNFVFAGNIGKAQSVETIILAANRLKDMDNIIFHIVGSGSNYDTCSTMVKELKLKNVIFYGRRPFEEMKEFYIMADAMLVTLKDERSFSCTLPSKVQSYMAAGKPIISAANGETKNVINEAKCGFCSDAENHQHLAENIIKFCKNGSKLKMALNSRAYYERYYSKDRFVMKLEKALVDLGEASDV